MARKKVIMTVYLEPEQIERLRLISAHTRVPYALYIRQGVDMVLAKLRAELHIWDTDGNLREGA